MQPALTGRAEVAPGSEDAPFQPLLTDPAYRYLVADFLFMRNVEPFAGLYIASA